MVNELADVLGIYKKYLNKVDKTHLRSLSIYTLAYVIVGY